GVVAEVHGVQPSDGPLPGGMRDRVQVTYPSVRGTDAGSLVRRAVAGPGGGQRRAGRPGRVRPGRPPARAARDRPPRGPGRGAAPRPGTAACTPRSPGPP